jgi:mRNA interferase RelE/StbE
VPFTLLYHPRIADEDLPSIPHNLQRRIAQAIETRLVQAPEQYGSPLTKTLKGYWKLRVGDYRVVYKIVGTEVRILGVRHRREIYKDILRRIGQHPE